MWQVIDLELPIQLKAKVVQTDPGVKGDTAGGGAGATSQPLAHGTPASVLLFPPLICCSCSSALPSLVVEALAFAALNASLLVLGYLCRRYEASHYRNRSHCVSSLVHCGGRRDRHRHPHWDVHGKSIRPSCHHVISEVK